MAQAVPEGVGRRRFGARAAASGHVAWKRRANGNAAGQAPE